MLPLRCNCGEGLAPLVVGRERPGFALVATDVPYRRIENLFDYQELTWDAPATDPASILPVLDALEPWGFFWLRTPAGDYDMRLRDGRLAAKWPRRSRTGGVGTHFGSPTAN